MTPSERLKSLQELGAAIRRQERELKREEPLRSAMPRLVYLRRLELAGCTMTAAELAEHQALEREIERDKQDERQMDWTR